MYIRFSKQTLDIDNGQNKSYDYDTKLDDLLIKATATTNPQKQQRLYSQAQKRLVQQAWTLPLYPIQTRLGISKRVQDVWIEPSEGEPVLHDAYLVKGAH
jgi:peptide/nickel transport system substrate-binding protein